MNKKVVLQIGCFLVMFALGFYAFALGFYASAYAL